jgi:hypothetical protein
MIDRLLEPGSTHLPDCKCGRTMELAGTKQQADDIQLKTFRCPRCAHELRLMVWTAEAVDDYV